ncbi:MAG: hypothetical protein ACTSR3_21435, partial [Candidatus Helarchaeota archaeon]
MEINFNVQGYVKSVPWIKEGRIINLAGDNGVGKSTAAMLMEMANGKHHFEDKRRFNSLINAIDKASIDFLFGDTSIQVDFTPNLWKYDKLEKKIKENSLGKYFKNGARIDIEEFKNDLSIQVIRGNETLSKQIEYIGIYFKDYLFGEIEKLQNKLEYLNNYKKKFAKNVKLEEIENYNLRQKEFSRESEIYESITEKYENLKKNFDELNKAKELLENLKFITKNDPVILKKKRMTLEMQINQKEKDHERVINEIKTYQRKISELEKHLDKEVSGLLAKREQLEKKFFDYIKKIKQLIDVESKFHKYTPREIEEGLEKEEIAKKNISKELHRIQAQGETQITIHNLIIELNQTSKKALETGFLDDFIPLEGDTAAGYVKLSFEDIFRLSQEKLIQIRGTEDFLDISEKIKDLNRKFKNKEKNIKLLSGFKDLVLEQKVIEKKIQTRGGSLDSYQEDENIDHWIKLINKNTEAKRELYDEIMVLREELGKV